MRKIPREYENPIDNVLLDWADGVLPLLRRLEATPNQVTLGSIAFEIAAIWALWAERPVIFGASYFMGVFLDYVDGHYARSDNMVSKLGDFLDHASDNLHVLGILAVVALKVGWPGALVPLGIVALFGALQSVHLGCQQKFYTRSREAGETLDQLRGLCAGDEERWMPLTRFVGVGTFQLVLACVAAWYVFGSSRRVK